MSEPQKAFNQYWEIKWQIINDIKLSRFACYLIIQNADPKKTMVALWGTMPEEIPVKDSINQVGKKLKLN